jgi:hypothetical protein
MTDSKTYQRIVLDMESPWNLQGDSTHVWHNKFSLSGTIAMSAADAEATALDLWTPISALTGATTSLVGWSYYMAEQTVAAFGNTYATGTHVGTRNAFTAGLSYGQQLEVCVLAQAPCGKNSRGKTVYLRKWIHDAAAESTDPNTIAPLASPATLFAKWDHGSGPHSVVPVDPTGGTAGTPWTAHTHLYTHQLRRGPRKKKASGSIGDISQALQDAAALRQLIEVIGSGAAA